MFVMLLFTSAVLVIQLASFLCSDGNRMALQPSTHDEECKSSKCAFPAKEHILLQMSHDHMGTPKRDYILKSGTTWATNLKTTRQREDDVKAQHLKNSNIERSSAHVERHNFAKWHAGGKEQLPSNRDMLVASTSVPGVSLIELADVDQQLVDPRESYNPKVADATLLTQDKNELESDHQHIDETVSQARRFFSLFVARVAQLSTLNPAVPLLCVLAVVIVALLAAAAVVLQGDGPRQELPSQANEIDDFPHPHSLGRALKSQQPQIDSAQRDRMASPFIHLRYPDGNAKASPFPAVRHPQCGTKSYSSRSAPRHAQELCPRLVVLSGFELVFNVPESLRAERQHIDFDIADPDGSALCHVSVDETSACARRGIFLKLLDGSPLAYVRTDPMYNPSPSRYLSEICRTNGELFCRLERADDNKDGSPFYVLRTSSGEDLFQFEGCFHENKFNAIHPDGTVACAIQRCTVKAACRSDETFYEVRVAAGVDAGLMLCGLLAFDKVRHRENQISLNR